MKLSQATMVVAALLATAPAIWSAPSLKVGDPAPKLQVGKWVQGEPVKQFEPGKAYVVEFWATWCAPCLISIPHLTELQKKFKAQGLVVIGVNCDNAQDDRVSAFVKKMGGKMKYRVVLDDKVGSDDGKMVETWMAAADQEAIPTAFIVDKKGRLAWIGGALSLDDQMIENVLAGKPVGREVAGK